MAEPTDLEGRVADLELQVISLTETVSQLRAAQDLHGQPLPPAQKKPRKTFKQGETSEELLSLVDKSYILPRVASTSFMVAIAIALRTASDSGTIDMRIGSMLGILYAFGLICYGWFAYRERSIHAPVFILWGTIVMCGVVVEAHRVFATVPAEVAYVTLAITGLVATVVSRLHHVALPVFVGTLGMSFGAFAIDYPNPFFPYLVVILGLANIFAAYATRLLRASWLRWLLLAMSAFMVQIWDMKLSIYLGKLSPENLDISVKGLLPSLAFLGMIFIGIALLGVLGKIQKKVSKFDLVLPIINVCLIFWSGYYAISLGLTTPLLFSWAAFASALAHLGIAWWLAHREPGGSLGTTSFALAGGLLLAFSAPQAFGNAVIAYALVALLAIGMARLSLKRDILSLRLASYLLQLYACGALVMLLWASDGAKPSLIGALSSGLLAAIAFYHYFWARKNPPQEQDALVNQLNKNDRGGGLLLVAALFSGFFTLRVGLYQTLDMLGAANWSTFDGAQSVLINFCAATLLILSLTLKNKELRNIAIVITMIGAGKIFVLDLMSLKGMPLMIGVFTFGLVAALASFVLSRWKKAPQKNAT
ncbi:MAG: DUF2339 domain-containing protein [Desulfuromonadales bacterium]|nr:DUF2339 domain-containing protein [Desulfuromonadales bacterium]